VRSSKDAQIETVAKTVDFA